MRSVLLITLVFATAFAPLTSAQSGSVQTMKAVLPVGTEGATAAWDGHYAYIFGGYDGAKRSDAILRYSPAADKIIAMTAKLPTPRFGATAVFVKGVAYIFGGHGCLERPGGFCDSVVRFDPAIDLAANLTNVFTSRPVYYMSAATDGNVVFLFGGADNSGHLRTVQRFDPLTREVSTMRAQFPEGRSQVASAYDGTNFFVFGGCVGSGVCSSAEVWKYEPGPDRLSQVNAQLPRKAQGPDAVWDGSGVYVIGGQDYPRELDVIARFNPATSTVTLLSAKLPTARFKAAAVWDGENAFVFGGMVQDDHLNDANSRRLADIVRFTPAAASTEPTHSFVPPNETHKKGLPGLEGVSALVVLAASVLLSAARRPRP